MKEFEEAPNMLLKLGIRDDVFGVLRRLVLKVKNGGSCNMRGPSHGILRFRTQSVTEKGRWRRENKMCKNSEEEKLVKMIIGGFMTNSVSGGQGEVCK